MPRIPKFIRIPVYYGFDEENNNQVFFDQEGMQEQFDMKLQELEQKHT